MELIILGCGSSLGSPWISNYWVNCDKKNKLNRRTRCSAFIKKGNLSILIDSSPDIKEQFIKNKINDLDCVLYTHEHSDQTSGIFELRPFFWKNKKKFLYTEVNEQQNYSNRNTHSAFLLDLDINQ